MKDNENRQQNSTINIDDKPADSTLGMETETNTTAPAPSKPEKNWSYYFHEILKGIAIFK